MKLDALQNLTHHVLNKELEKNSIYNVPKTNQLYVIKVSYIKTDLMVAKVL